MRSMALVLGVGLLAGCTEGMGMGGADRPELAEGTRIAATTAATISSETHAGGDRLTVRVSRDVTDSSGTVVIPAGAEVSLAIDQIAPGANKGEKGTLTFSVGDVIFDGESHGLDARVVDYSYQLKGTGVGSEEVAKTAIGGVAGAVVGRTVGGEKGTIPGAIGGAAAGAAVADYSQDRNIVVPAGSSVTLELTGSFRG
jgi:hypothetical protein